MVCWSFNMPAQYSAGVTVQIPVHIESVPAGSSIDGATKRTVEKMAQYIREAANDPAIRALAVQACNSFAQSPGGALTPEQKCWAVFWYVKHNVRFEQDEKTMLEVGVSNQEQDLLIHPSVLVRMKDPREDCDGFSMLCASLLESIGVRCLLAAEAVNPRDPERWSHVFVIALTPGGPLALDTSHGPKPGWMVPLYQVSRWQCWDAMSGERRDDVRPSQMQVHGVGAFDWGAFVNNMADKWTDIAGSVIRPAAYQQTIRDPQTGQLISTTVRSGVSPSTAFTAGAGAAAAIPTAYIVGGVGLLAVVFLMSQRGGRR